MATVPYNLLGHVSALIFVCLYYLGSRDSTVGSTLFASICALGGYAATAWGLSSMKPSLLSAAAVSFVTIAIFSFIFSGIPDTTIDRPVHYTPGMVIFRILISTVMVLAITGLARSVGTSWAGLFSAFPLVVFPLLVLIHLNYGAQRAHTVLKSFPRGLWTVLVYSITISLTYGRYGVFLGTTIGYLAATTVLLAINWRVFFESKSITVSLDKVLKEAKL
ncbi:MAG: hypothetical protein RRA15_09675 [bacterium]|nr:hypothetical protein [bacterium]MDT8366748.1 hypothetical protein [bacterium]